MSFIKRRKPSVSFDNYIQTAISDYFKTNKDYQDSQRTNVKVRILSEYVDAGPSTTAKGDRKFQTTVTNDSAVMPNEQFKIGSDALTKLPFTIPRYTFSEDSDSDVALVENNPTVITVSSSGDEEQLLESPFKGKVRKRKYTSTQVLLNTLEDNQKTSTSEGSKQSKPNTAKDNRIFSLQASIGVHFPVITLRTKENDAKPNILNRIDTNSNFSVTVCDNNFDVVDRCMNVITNNIQKSELENKSIPVNADGNKIHRVDSSEKKTNDKEGKKQTLNDEEQNWNPVAVLLFTKIVKFVGTCKHLKALLTPSEANTLEKFFSMEQTEYKFLCLKLFTRIHRWYNIFKLKTILNINMPDTEVKIMYDCLVENEFVDSDCSSTPCIDLLNCMLKKDIKDICKSFKIKVSNETKRELIERLLSNCNRQATLTFTKTTQAILMERIKEKLGICIKLNNELLKLFNKVHLLYMFTTTTFSTISDLYFFLSGIHFNDVVMPKYVLNEDVEIFSSVEEFTKFSEAYECRQALENSLKKKELGHTLELCELAFTKFQEIIVNFELPKYTHLKRFTAGHKYAGVLFKGAKHLARHHPRQVKEWLSYLIHQDQFCVHNKGMWYDLLIMVQYNYLEEKGMAVDTLLEALKNEDIRKVKVQYYELNERAKKIKKNTVYRLTPLQCDQISFAQPPQLEKLPFIEIDARTIHDKRTGSKRKYVIRTNGGKEILTVEQVALDHYLKNGFTNGIHCEGALIQTLCFILFWDIIYESAVPNTFIQEIQYFPLDFMTTYFYINRKTAIDTRINEIMYKWSLQEFENVIRKTWNEHNHEKSFIAHSIIKDSNELVDISLCIGRTKLAALLKTIIVDFNTNHSGLPDLFLWNVMENKCKFVEVKGERDTLSTKQRLWLDYLLSIGAAAEVCHVHTTGSKTGRKEQKKRKYNKVG